MLFANRKKLVDYQLATYPRTDNRKGKEIPIAKAKAFTHEEADAIQMDISVTSKAFGESSVHRTPPAQASYVLLARVNREDLELQVARAFAHFCKFRIKRHLLPAPGIRSVQLKESFRKHLTKENWEKYRNNWMVLVEYDRKSRKVPRKQPVQSV